MLELWPPLEERERMKNLDKVMRMDLLAPYEETTWDKLPLRGKQW
jgi:hypothetical protein